MPLIVSLEAAIASGKSTLLTLIKQRFGSRVHVVQEPVLEWQQVEGKKGHNLLGLYYEDMARWSFTFQMYALLTHVRCIQNAIHSLEKEERDAIIVVERSYETSKEMFARMLLESGHMSELEFALYEAWWKQTVAEAPAFDGHMYLRTTPDTAMKRLKERDRVEETSVTYSYQSDLIARHERWISQKSQILVLDGEANIFDRDVFDLVCSQIEGFFDGLAHDTPRNSGNSGATSPTTIGSSSSESMSS